MSPDYDTILSHLRASYRPGQVFEIRVLYRYTARCQVGYFDDPIAAANAVVHSDDGGVAGFYTTINAVHPECIHRAYNRLIDAKAGSYTKDTEIPYRSSVFLDIDPIREVSGISSTDAEHAEAIELAYKVDGILQGFYGFPPASIVDSGNGAHLTWQTEPLPNDEETTALVRQFLIQTKAMFQTATQDFDKGNFNAARIKRLPGTTARKGEDSPDRPHRLSRILVPVDPLAPVLTRSLIESLTGPTQAIPKPIATSPIQTPQDNLYRRLNDYALKHLSEWVPYVFGDMAYATGDGYRIKSRNLQRDLEEDISISPKGIKDFGVADMGDATEGRRTATQLLTELQGIEQKAAAEFLALTLNYPLNEFEATPMTPPPPTMNGHSNGMPASLIGGIEARLEDHFSTNIWKKDYGEKREIIKDLLPENQYTLLYALPKVGKSTMARQMVVSVVTGMDFMERPVLITGEVLYVSYEEDERHWYSSMLETYRWMAAQNGVEVTEQSIQGLFDSIHIITNKSRLVGETSAAKTHFPRGEAGIGVIRDFLEKHPAIKLVVLDPYESVFEDGGTKDVKKQQRNEGELIKTLYTSSQISVVVVDHSKKEAARFDPMYADVTNGTSGTTQKPASADTIIAINVYPPLPDDKLVPGMPKGASIGFMEAKGREIPGFRDNVQFIGPYGWIKLEDDFPMPKLSEVRETGRGPGAKPQDPLLNMKILTVLEKEGPKSAQELAEILNTSYQIARRVATKMASESSLLVDRSAKTIMYCVPMNGHVLKDIL